MQQEEQESKEALGSAEPQFTATARGNPMIVIGEYKFLEHSRYKQELKKRWNCSMMHRRCRAFLVTIEDEIIRYHSKHNH
ncbi:FLYWCH zinc finger domain-containing protein [Phthorimaea operculella]|nr:FLYWCH zinc finger domain-containing protein [Phthorimaea operculella]